MEDFKRLIELLLPTFLRQKRILALLNVLIGGPMEQRYSDYNIWRVGSRYDASITPQVCSLRNAIELKYDVHCSIIELDGRPYDYLVEIDRSTDYNSIYNFLQKYGPAGKSFVFNLGDTTLDSTWSDFVEYDEVTTYEVSWSDYIEADDGDTPIDIFFYYIPKIEERKLTYCIEVRANAKIDDYGFYFVTYKGKELWYMTAWKEHIIIPDGSHQTAIFEDVSGEEFERNLYVRSGALEGKTPKRNYYIDHIYYINPEEIK
ncbi:hypothetical protein [Porphyromonas levii]|uniref:hypothetical protein n=1 Tax=Porphyromonas levii TaxID=28114 RepID=UPI001B8C7E15|nr:hypothetical protein [Porphyromonas levii]MBR8759285.1 hypothetical protein [Porphyromonas levii]